MTQEERMLLKKSLEYYINTGNVNMTNFELIHKVLGNLYDSVSTTPTHIEKTVNNLKSIMNKNGQE